MADNYIPGDVSQSCTWCSLFGVDVGWFLCRFEPRLTAETIQSWRRTLPPLDREGGREGGRETRDRRKSKNVWRNFSAACVNYEVERQGHNKHN